MSVPPHRLRTVLFFVAGLLLHLLFGSGTSFLQANVPGGGTGTGANVTLTGTASSSTTFTMSNGIVSLTIVKSSAQITAINYTFNNTGTSQTLNLVSGNSNGGKLYWEHSNNQGLSFTVASVVDPTSNGGDYAEVALYSATQANMPFEVHYSMRRGSTGFYVTPIFIHDSTNGSFGLGECRDNIYAGSIFNWMSVDSARNKLMPVTGGTATTASGAPVECSLWTSGLYQGQYEDKYKYGADFWLTRVWGWSSVGTSGKNVGLWNVTASAEYYNGGPMKRELTCHMGTTILNMINGGHYGSLNQDNDVATGEVWNKVCGPYFIYCNSIPNSVTDMTQASGALYADALAQATAEQTAWPYAWFSNPYYSSASNRGTVIGKIAINDTYNPNASSANLWVGVVQQPVTSNGAYDFQIWAKPYQFWTKTDAAGNFTIPAVIAGSNYTLYAFGPGAAGTFQSQAQTGGNTPNLEDIPATPFAVSVTGGATTNLGVVTWTPARVAPTVFEIGYPDRTSAKFRHGDDYWVGDMGPSPSVPSPVWNKHLEYPFDFPTGPKYTVGSSRWSTDWNYVQPAVRNSAGGFGGSTSTINFNLPSALTGTASLYLGLASDYQGPLVVKVNGTDIAGSTGFFPNYNSSAFGSNVTIREANHGIFSDIRLSFSASLLKAGANTITINMRKGDSTTGDAWMNHAMYDYLRLEAPNYVPPAPGSVTAFAGNGSALLSWPAVPGATSYTVLRSTTSGSGYTALPVSVTGPVCGSGLTNATFTDTTALNGTTYYYVVKSVNPVGSSANSSSSAGVTPSASVTTTAPMAPSGVVTTSSGATVNVSWNAVGGANYYTVYRSTLVSNGAGAYNTLSTIPLANNITGTTYTDFSPTGGTIHSYSVVAANAVGSSSTSAAPTITPRETAPAVAPVLTAAPGTQKITLNWTAVSGASGYVIQNAATAGGPYTFVTSVSQLNYTDNDLADNTPYYYVVTAMNSGGSIASNEATATTAPAAPTGLAATAGNTQITLKWTASPAATTYAIGRSTTTGGTYTAVGTSSGPSFADSGLTNGTLYYYVVTAGNANGTSVESAEVSATPISTVPVAPTNLAASVSNQKIVLTWSAGSGATSYTLLRSAVSGGPYTTAATGLTALTYTDSSVTYGTTNYYVVVPVNAGGSGAYSNQASATVVSPFVKWTGATSTTWDVATTANWLSGSTATPYYDGYTVTFDDTASKNTVAIGAAVSPFALTFNNSTLNYTVSGSAITGSTGLVKTGTGSVTLSSSNSFTGGTSLSSGTLILGNASALGTGAVTLSGGQLTTGTLAPANVLNVTGSAILRGGASGSSAGLGVITGAGDLEVQIITSVLDFRNDLSQFTGTISLTNAGGAYMRLNSSLANSSPATFQIGSGVILQKRNSALSSVSLGGLAGAGTLSGSSGNGNSTTTGYVIGANGRDTTFAGVIANGGGAVSLTKTGAGALTLAGTASTYTGVTTINGGILAVGALANGGSTSSIGASSSVAGNLVLDGGTLRYSGVGGTSTDRAFTISTAGATLDASGNGAVVFANTGALTLAGSNTARTLTLTGSSTAANTLAAAIGNNGTGDTSLVKTGAGTWVLSSGSSSYGSTTIGAGVLRVANSITNSGTVSVTGGVLDLAGTINAGRVEIAGAGTLTGSGQINGSFSNSGTVVVAAGTLTLNGPSLVNYGTMRFTGGAAFSVTGTFVNNGVLDIMTGGGLPANFINNGIVIDSSSAKISDCQISGSNTVLSAQTYAGHTYQLQGRDSLVSGTWENIGPALEGNNAVQSFTDANGAQGMSRFYRLIISP